MDRPQCDVCSEKCLQICYHVTGDGGGIMADLDAAHSPRIIVSHPHWNLLPPKIRQGQVKVSVPVPQPPARQPLTSGCADQVYINQ